MDIFERLDLQAVMLLRLLGWCAVTFGCLSGALIVIRLVRCWLHGGNIWEE